MVATEEAFDLVVAMHRLMRSLRRASPTQPVSPSQLIVLSLLWEAGPLRVGAIADRVPCSQPTATTVVAALENVGYVRREPDPADGRATQVAITTTGRDAMTSFAHSQAEVLAHRLEEIDTDAAQVVLSITTALHALAENPLEEQ